MLSMLDFGKCPSYHRIQNKLHLLVTLFTSPPLFLLLAFLALRAMLGLLGGRSIRVVIVAAAAIPTDRFWLISFQSLRVTYWGYPLQSVCYDFVPDCGVSSAPPIQCKIQRKVRALDGSRAKMRLIHVSCAVSFMQQHPAKLMRGP